MFRWWFTLVLFVGCKPQPASYNVLKERSVHFQISYQFRIEDVRNLRVEAILPGSVPGRQEILSMEYSLTPRVEATPSGDSIGHFRYYRPKDTVELVIRGDAKLLLDTAIQSYPDSLREKLLKIQKRVADSFEYQLQGTDLNLDKAIASGRGDCTEYAAYAVRLCKENGFEGRELAGIHSRKGMEAFHSWAECRWDSLPWVLLDPTWADEDDNALDSAERPGIQAIRNLQPTTWKLQIGRNPRLEYGFRMVSWRVDRGKVSFESSAWVR